MAMLCKEQGLMIMVNVHYSFIQGIINVILMYLQTFCGVYEVIVINKVTFRNLIKNVKISKIVKLLKRESLERLFLMTVGFCIILYGRWTIMGSPPIFQKIDNPASFLTSPIERVHTFIYFYYSIIVDNFKLLKC